VLLTNDPAATLARLDAGELACPSCGGQLGPWGHARRRIARGDNTGAHRPRRTRCRACRATHVVLSARRFPRRADTARTVGKALLAATGGLGHRQVAELVDRPATTVRDWLRRARANSDLVRADAALAAYQLDPNLNWRPEPTGTTLGDMVETLGTAIAAWARRFGPVEDPWALAVQLTGGGILAARPQPVWQGRR
jgi:transposase-like protein